MFKQFYHTCNFCTDWLDWGVAECRSRITVAIMAESIFYPRVNLVLARLCIHIDSPRQRESLSTKVFIIFHWKNQTYQFPPCLAIRFWSQLEQGKTSTDSFILLVLVHLRSHLGSVKPLLNLTTCWTWQLLKVRRVEITTWTASPECFDLMWLAIPELEASLVLQPALPRLTNLLQCRHRTSRKSPENCSIPGNYSNQRRIPSTFWKWVHHGLVCGLPAMTSGYLGQSWVSLKILFLFLLNCLFSATVCSWVHPHLGQEQSSSCSYFKKRNIIAETKNWHAIYCLFISDSCFQLLHADRKFWSHRYLFLHLCTHISGNTGYSEREIFLPDRKNKNSFKELIAMKGPVESDAKKCAGDNSGSYWINRISLFPVPLNP